MFVWAKPACRTMDVSPPPLDIHIVLPPWWPWSTSFWCHFQATRVVHGLLVVPSKYIRLLVAFPWSTKTFSSLSSMCWEASRLPIQAVRFLAKKLLWCQGLHITSWWWAASLKKVEHGKGVWDDFLLCNVLQAVLGRNCRVRELFA